LIVPLLYLAVVIVCLVTMHRRITRRIAAPPKTKGVLSALECIGIIPATLHDVAATVGPCDVLLFHVGISTTLVMAALVVSGGDPHAHDANIICSCSAFPQRGKRVFPQLGELLAWLRGLSANRDGGKEGICVTLLRQRNRSSASEVVHKLSAAATVVPCDPTRSCFAYIGALLETVGLVPRSLHPWRDYSSELMTDALLRSNAYYIHTRFML
jgi:hypothetical protein